MSAPAKRPATRVTSAPVSVATAILPKSARQPTHGQRAATGGTAKNKIKGDEREGQLQIRHLTSSKFINGGKLAWLDTAKMTKTIIISEKFFFVLK